MFPYNIDVRQFLEVHYKTFFASSWGEKLDTLDLQGVAKGFCTSILLDLFLTV